jgi:hypothetical protein
VGVLVPVGVGVLVDVLVGVRDGVTVGLAVAVGEGVGLPAQASPPAKPTPNNTNPIGIRIHKPRRMGRILDENGNRRNWDKQRSAVMHTQSSQLSLASHKFLGRKQNPTP